jgi:hypothetical protein
MQCSATKMGTQDERHSNSLYVVVGSYYVARISILTWFVLHVLVYRIPHEALKAFGALC